MDFKIIVRDITQAFTQADSIIQRSIFIRVPRELNTTPNMLLRNDHLFYGLPKSGLHLFVTYHNCFITRLSMSAAVREPYLFFAPGYFSKGNRSSSKPRVITALQTEDTFHVVNGAFFEIEQAVSKVFEWKPKTYFCNRSEITFNGRPISMVGKAAKLRQTEHTNNMEQFNEDNIDQSISVS